jgi:branched-chain amino acid transport system substrate-binding protein
MEDEMPVTRRGSVLALSALAATALALAGCGGGSSGVGAGSSPSTSSGASSPSSTSSSTGTSGSSGGAYNWGVDSENSGQLAYYGGTITAGVKAYVDQVNAAGGINGHKITLTVLDSAGDSSRTATNATQLATSDKVDAIFGNTLSSDCSAATPVVVRYKVPMACLSVDQNSPFVYGLGAGDASGASALLAGAKKTTGKSNPKVALVYINTLTDEAMAKAMVSAAKSAGADLVTSQEANIAATDVSDQVSKVVASHPDALLISDTGPGMLMVLKGIRAAGLNIPVVWLDGTGNLPTLATSTDKGVYPLDVTLVPTPTSTGSAAQSFVKGFGATIKGSPTTITLNAGEAVPGYVTAQVFGAALKSCGFPCSGAQLQTQLDKTQIPLPGLVKGNFGYTATQHYPYATWYLLHQVGTKITLDGSFPNSG